MVQFESFLKTLNEVTDLQPADAAFLENSRSNEKFYSNASARRWYEIVRILETINLRRRCLDIGTSPLTFLLKVYFEDVDTLDFTDHFDMRCRAAGINLYLAGSEWMAETIPDKSYDCIIFLEVIEHLHMNPVQVLNLLRQKLRPGGMLIMSTPNLMCLGNRIRMLFNSKLLHYSYPPFVPVGLHGHGHDRVYTPAEMEEYLLATEWSSFEVGYHGVEVCDSIAAYPMGKKVAHFPAQIIKRIVPSTRQQMLIIAKK